MSATILSGRYRLERVLGQGGMGQVHLAHDSQLQRRVAIMLPADAESDTHARARLRREALAIAALDHPFICKIHEVGEDDGRTVVTGSADCCACRRRRAIPATARADRR
jgi:serine/threonine-protein kinase